jgi:hypothetical protein
MDLLSRSEPTEWNGARADVFTVDETEEKRKNMTINNNDSNARRKAFDSNIHSFGDPPGTTVLFGF